MDAMRYQPEWHPLEQALSRSECEEFMYMAHVGPIVLYKHWLTRRYLNIDAVTGKFYRYADGQYLEITQDEALSWLRNPS